MSEKLLPGMSVLLLEAVVPRAQELSSLFFMLCWALGPQSSPWDGQSLSSQVSESKEDIQIGSQARERLPFQPHSGSGLVPPCPWPLPESSSQHLSTDDCRGLFAELPEYISSLFPLNPTSGSAKKWFGRAPRTPHHPFKPNLPNHAQNQHMI